MSIRARQARQVLSVLLDAVNGLKTPTWPLVKPEIDQMEIGLPRLARRVVWPDGDYYDRAVLDDGRSTHSVHLRDDRLETLVSIQRVRKAIASCQKAMDDAMKRAAILLDSAPEAKRRLESELNALFLAGAELPDVRADHRLLLPIAWRISKLKQLSLTQGMVARLVTGLVASPIMHEVSLNIRLNIRLSYGYLVCTIVCEYCKLGLTLKPPKIEVALDGNTIRDPFKELPIVARAVPEPYWAVKAMDFLDQILENLQEEE
jgi:hypothetical protein